MISLVRSWENILSSCLSPNHIDLLLSLRSKEENGRKPQESVLREKAKRVH